LQPHCLQELGFASRCEPTALTVANSQPLFRYLRRLLASGVAQQSTTAWRYKATFEAKLFGHKRPLSPAPCPEVRSARPDRHVVFRRSPLET